MSGVETSGVARSYGGKSADERVTARRVRLVEAAITLLATDGEARTTMTAVCAEAGLTERYFYESFASRDDLLVAALDSVSEDIATVALDAIGATSGDPADRVRAAISAFVEFLVAAPDRMRVAVVESSANAALRARRHEILETFAALVADEARALFSSDAWEPPRDHVQGLVFIAGISELVASWLGEDVTLSPDELTTTTSDALVALMRRP